VAFVGLGPPPKIPEPPLDKRQNRVFNASVFVISCVGTNSEPKQSHAFRNVHRSSNYAASWNKNSATCFVDALHAPSG